jgi:penicillin-binding protein 1A
LSNYTLGATPKLPADIVALGDIIYVQAQQAQWLLSQAPEISGALLALNPHNGAIVAVMGGYDYESSKFNRATQAYRQPGSNFKPFIYAVALENGYTTASVINDAPIVYNDAPLEDYWRPQNDSRRFYGPTRLRTGLTKSRNLVSIRLLQGIGVEAALDILARFGFNKQDMPHGLSLALGTMNTTPLDISVGYAAFANGGFKITPFVINKITNHEGKWLYQANPYVACPECDKDLATYLQHASDAATEHNAPRILSAETAYMMNSMLLDAIQTGTGRRAKVLKRQDIGGKTGTTNDKMDAWFSGFSSELVVTTWLGFDEPHTLKEYAAQAALPIWIDFMQHALVGQPEKYLDPPPGLVTVKIDPETGLLARSGQSNAIFEIFRAAEVPLEVAPALFNTRNVAITPSADTQEDSLF